MLVLSRKKSESVVITVGDVAITVMVVEIHSDKCRLGFEAPLAVKIHRSEVCDRIKAGIPQSAKPAGAAGQI